MGDPGKRKDFHGGIEFRRGLRHSEDDGGVAILGDGVMLSVSQTFQAERSVLAHSREQDANDSAGPKLNRAREKDIDGRPIGIGAGFGGVIEMPGIFEDEVIIRAGEQGNGARWNIARFGNSNGDAGLGGQPISKALGKLLVNMLDDDKTCRKQGRKLLEDFGQRERSASGGANGDQSFILR